MLLMLDRLEKLLKALKTSPVLPSLSLPKPKVIQTSSKFNTKLPGLPQSSKKNPMKVAEQIQTSDIKDQKMREAQEYLKINKSTGQWSL